MVYALLCAGLVCLLVSLNYSGPPSWVLGILGIVLMVCSYLWEVYRK